MRGFCPPALTLRAQVLYASGFISLFFGADTGGEKFCIHSEVYITVDETADSIRDARNSVIESAILRGMKKLERLIQVRERSLGNDFSGDIAEFFRNERLNAYKFVNRIREEHADSITLVLANSFPVYRLDKDGFTLSVKRIRYLTGTVVLMPAAAKSEMFTHELGHVRIVRQISALTERKVAPLMLKANLFGNTVSQADAVLKPAREFQARLARAANMAYDRITENGSGIPDNRAAEALVRLIKRKMNDIQFDRLPTSLDSTEAELLSAR